MGCGASAPKVAPSIQESTKDIKPKERPKSAASIRDENNNKIRSAENVRPSSNTKILAKRPSSNNGSIHVPSSPKGTKNKIFVRDSRGSVRPQSASSINDDVERRFSAGLNKRESREKLFQATTKAPTPPPALSFLGDSPMKPKPLAFEVPLSSKPPGMLPPRRLESLKNAPKPLTAKELEDKIRLSEERRELEIQRKKLKSSRMSRRKREIIAAREQSNMQEKAEELKEKMDSTVNKRERLQAEIVEKQKKQREHAARVRERAQRMKLGNGDENDEGLGGEMETYKPDSDDEPTNQWSTHVIETQKLTKANTSTSMDSRASLDTNDSGIPKHRDENTDDFYNA